MTDPKLRNILDMPVEVLGMIFSMLGFRDKVSLSKVCHSFNSILLRREINQYIDLRECYDVAVSDVVPYINHKYRVKYVISLDLTSCYWIPSLTLRKILTKLKNLETLHAVDTSLKAADVKEVLQQLPKLTDIAFSWCGHIDITEPLKKLKCVYIYSPYKVLDPMERILTFVRLCENLEKLSVVRCEFHRGASIYENFARQRRHVLNLPKLRSLVVIYPNLERDRYSRDLLYLSGEEIPDVPINEAVWEKYWCIKPYFTPANVGIRPPPAKVVYLERHLPAGCLSHVERVRISSEYFYRNRLTIAAVINELIDNVRSLAIPANGTGYALSDLLRNGNQLEELNIIGLKTIPPSFWEYSAGKVSGHHLLKLGLPVSVLERSATGPSNSGKADDASPSFGKRPRVSHLKPYLAAGSILESIVSLCPNVEEFEIGLETRDPAYEIVRELSGPPGGLSSGNAIYLSSVARWKNLQRLTICGIRAMSLMFLDEIARNCPNIVFLSLLHLDLTAAAYNMPELGKILPLFTQLQDFILQQPDARCGDTVLLNLRQKSLRRVSVRCDPFTPSVVEEFLAKCDKVVFFLFVSGTHKVHVDRLRKKLSERFGDRQGLVIRLIDRNKSFPTGYSDACLKDLPAVHENEMMYEGHKVAYFPFSGPKYIHCE